MSQLKPVVYRSTKYGFTLLFPGWWKPYVIVNSRKLLRETESEVHFRFKYKGKLYEDIFTILVYRMTRKQWIKEYDDSPLVFIAEHNGRVFAYITPEELPEAFYNEKIGDYDYKRFGIPINLLKRMVNKDVPSIVKTIRFQAPGCKALSAPYRSAAVRCRGCYQR